MEQPNFEQIKWQHGLRREDALRTHDSHEKFSTQVNDAAMQSGQFALRMAMLINGGAAISVLTFLGALAGKDKTSMAAISSVAASLVWFAAGVALSVVAMAAAYFTNYCTVSTARSQVLTWEHPYTQDGPKTKRWRRMTLAFHVVAVIVGFASVVMFAVGMLVPIR